MLLLTGFVCGFQICQKWHFFYIVQWKHWSQIRSTIYNISSKIGQSGCGNTKKKVWGGWRGERGGGAPVWHSGIFLQCGEFIENSLIPHSLTSFRGKKLNPTSVIRAERFINPPERSHFHNSTKGQMLDVRRSSWLVDQSELSQCFLMWLVGITVAVFID